MRPDSAPVPRSSAAIGRPSPTILHHRAGYQSSERSTPPHSAGPASVRASVRPAGGPLTCADAADSERDGGGARARRPGAGHRRPRSGTRGNRRV